MSQVPAHPVQLWRQHRGWLLLFMALFLATHGQEVMNPTLNVDDWALVLDPIHQASLSRPGWDLIYGGLFQGSFSPSVGWLLAGLSIYASALAASVVLPVLTPPWVCLLALITASHAYLLDLLNFSFCIGLYLLPAPLSLGGALLMGYWRGPQRPLAWGVGVALFAFAMAIYQPTGVVGLGVVGLEALALAFGLGARPRRAGWRVLAGVLAGGGAYALWARLMMAGQVANERTGLVTMARLLRKLRKASVFQEVYSTDVPLVPHLPQLVLSLSFLGLLVLATVWLGRQLQGRERRRRLALLWLGAGALTLLPFALYFLLKSGFPSRAFALGNFGIGAVMVTILASWQASPAPGSRGGSRAAGRWSRAVVVGLALVVLLPQAMAFSKVWDRQALLAQRDQALALQILADVHGLARAEGLPTQRFVVYGSTGRTELFPHWSSVGQSALGESWAIKGLFANLLGVEVEHRSPKDLAGAATLPACAAYPEPGSLRPLADRVLVCLEAHPAGSSGERSPG